MVPQSGVLDYEGPKYGVLACYAIGFSIRKSPKGVKEQAQRWSCTRGEYYNYYIIIILRALHKERRALG